MADSFPVRITGQVLNVEQRTGVSGSTGKSYDLRTVTVLIGMAGVIPVTYPGDYSEGIPRQGDVLDILASASVYAPVSPSDGRPVGRIDLQFRVMRDFPAELPVFATV
jgi:hypothetical protein